MIPSVFVRFPGVFCSSHAISSLLFFSSLSVCATAYGDLLLLLPSNAFSSIPVLVFFVLFCLARSFLIPPRFYSRLGL